ncbi:MAG: tetratricopeptide repeat protein [Candidatus Methanospirareceae archaeon]
MMRYGMTYTPLLKELLNELKLARGKNCLIFAISGQPARLKEAIESANFKVSEIYLKGNENLLEILLGWKDTAENCVYLVHGIGNQFPWVLPYINLHRDLFFDIKRPVVVAVNEYEIREIQKHAPDWFRFRSRTYELKEEEPAEEKVITRLAEPAESKPVYYPLPVLEEESEEELKERIKIDEYLLSSERDDYKRAELYMSLSLSYFKLGDFERGEEYLRESNDIRAKLKDKRGILLNYTRLSSIFISKRDFEKVIDICNEALKIEPDSEVFYITRGNAYANLNEHERAIEDYDRAIALNPDDAAAYNNRGLAYAELNKYEQALEDFSKAIELNPALAEAYYNRGLTYANLNEPERAIKDYNRAIELNPAFAEAYYNRGLAYAELNKYEQALEDFSKAIELNPDDAEAYGNRGIAYSEIHRYRESARDLKKAGILFLHSGREEDAVKAFYICFKLRDKIKIENDDIVYCGLALLLLTSDADIMNELKGMRIQDENLRRILELMMRKLRREDISEEMAVLVGKEKRNEMMPLLELLKRF